MAPERTNRSTSTERVRRFASASVVAASACSTDAARPKPVRSADGAVAHDVVPAPSRTMRSGRGPGRIVIKRCTPVPVRDP